MTKPKAAPMSLEEKFADGKGDTLVEYVSETTGLTIFKWKAPLEAKIRYVLVEPSMAPFPVGIFNLLREAKEQAVAIAFGSEAGETAA
jgi:hypothetical protein